MLPTSFSFIWVLQMLIGYSTFLKNIYFGILFFQLGIFVTGFIQASMSKIQGLLKASPTVFKDLKLLKKT